MKTNKEMVIELSDEMITNVPDFPKAGIQFKDITPVFENVSYTKLVLDAMEDEISDIKFDKIICAESRGFLFGVPLGQRKEVGVVLARKPGKLPRPGYSVNYGLEYGTSTLQVSKGSLKQGEKVLVVDDLLATGGSANAMCQLAEKAGAVVVGCLFFIELTGIPGRKVLGKYPVKSILAFDEE